jgi:hypothetical protein
MVWGISTVMTVKAASVRERRGSNKLPIDQEVAHRHCRERKALPLASLPRRQKKP